MKPKMKPILFNTEMVRADLEGRKTVTRRLVLPQPKMRLAYVGSGNGCGKWGYPGADAYKYWGAKWKRPEDITADDEKLRWTPPCHAGDILYARETWCDTGGGNIIYRADADIRGSAAYYLDRRAGSTYDAGVRWRPSIHMPKKAARIFLRVTDVRVERLQDIDERGAKAEGFRNDIDLLGGTGASATKHFAVLWDSTIKKADRARYGWDANPWVWVIEFEHITKEEANQNDCGE